MAYPTWRFAPLNGGVKQGLSIGGMETFKGSPFDALAREICQNSLDAHDPESTDPVMVTFTRQFLKKKDYDVFDGLQYYIDQCEKCWGEQADYNLASFLGNAKAALKAEEIPTLVVSDFNTTGLTGISCDLYAKTLWNSLTSADGVSDKPSGSGGSYGIGKLAPFVCSSFNTVLYNTYAKDERRAFQGVARLASLLDDQDRPTQGVGQYRINEENSWRPIFEEDKCPLRDRFIRTEYGTDIIILGFRNEDDWEKVVVNAITKNFFVAIAEKKLVVKVDDVLIDDVTIKDLLSKDLETREMVNAGQLYSAFCEADDVVRTKIYQKSTGEYDVELFLKTGSNLNKQRAYFKKTGMLVCSQGKAAFVSYAAVLVVRSDELAELLVAAEPPAHDKWNAQNIIDNPEKRKEAKAAIIGIRKWIDQVISGKQDSDERTSIDAGIGEYLPDTALGDDSDKKGEDELRVNQKLSKKVVRIRKASAVVDSSKGTGVPTEGSFHNESHRDGIPPIANPVPPVVEGEGVTEGIVKKKKGTKQRDDVAMTASRIVPRSASQGIYRIVLQPIEFVSKAFISVSAIGDDGSLTRVPIKTCRLNNTPLHCSDGRVGPLEMNAGEPLELNAVLDSAETLALSLKVSEVSE